MAETLRKGIVEEEVNQNLNAAIQTYQSVVAQFDEERKTAAAALFRLAECYRKQGKNDQAIAAYKRIVQEFPDQTKLAEQSRSVLTKTFKLPPQQAAIPLRPTERQPAVYARERYRALLEDEIKLVVDQIKSAQRRVELGSARPDEITKLQKELLELQRSLAAFDLGVMPPGTPIPR
jgi:tetratricopeptide (TPR) repeat protein